MPERDSAEARGESALRSLVHDRPLFEWVKREVAVEPRRHDHDGEVRERERRADQNDRANCREKDHEPCGSEARISDSGFERSGGIVTGGSLTVTGDTIGVGAGLVVLGRLGLVVAGEGAVGV